MKKVAIICLLIALSVVLTACGSKKINGTWTPTSTTAAGSLTFNEGVLIMDILGYQVEGTYTQENDTLTITIANPLTGEESTVSYNYTIEKNVLSMAGVDYIKQD